MITSARIRFAFLALLGCTAASPITALASTYQVEGRYGYDNLTPHVSGLYVVGPQSTAAHLSQSGGDTLGTAIIAGDAVPGLVSAYVKVNSPADNNGHADGSVTSTLTDSLFFSGPAGGTEVRINVHLNSKLALDGAPAGAQATLDFSPNGNTGYFNTGLHLYDTLDSNGRHGDVDGYIIVTVPDGDPLNFIVQLTASANASKQSTLFSVFSPNSAQITDSSYVTVDVLTPGATFSSASGATYSATPEPAAWALLMLGIGGMGAALRTRHRKVAAQGLSLPHAP